MVTERHEVQGVVLPDPGPVGRSVAYAEEALELAGRALDANRPGGPSLSLGRLLLREAFIAAARATCRDDSLASIDAALDALRQRAETQGSTGLGRPSDAAALLGEAALPDRTALRQAELEVARLLDAATGRRRVVHANRRALWIVSSLVVGTTVALILATLALRRPWERYTWVASSACCGFAGSGTLGDHDWIHDLVFHTAEQEDPSVIIDLLAERTVEKVTVVNRADCCQDRGLPLAIDLAGPDRQFVQVAFRTSTFDVWQATFPRQKARYVRLHAKSKTILQFRDVEIR
jgi:hypothetical protein